MLLIRHSERANNAVRAVSPGGELFVASVVIFMILVSFGDAVDPALFGEAGLEFGLFDLGGEFSVLALGDLHLLQLLLACRGVELATGDPGDLVQRLVVHRHRGVVPQATRARRGVRVACLGDAAKRLLQRRVRAP